jgi:GNAT superfamily N-acetyltransferase
MITQHVDGETVKAVTSAGMVLTLNWDDFHRVAEGRHAGEAVGRLTFINEADCRTDEIYGMLLVHMDVDAAFQRQGLATALLQLAIDCTQLPVRVNRFTGNISADTTEMTTEGQAFAYAMVAKGLILPFEPQPEWEMDQD